MIVFTVAPPTSLTLNDKIVESEDEASPSSPTGIYYKFDFILFILNLSLAALLRCYIS